MATFCWHIIIISDYKLMWQCRYVQAMEHFIFFNVFDDGSELFDLIFTNLEQEEVHWRSAL